MENYYNLLGVEHNASKQEIEKAISLNKNNLDEDILNRISLSLLDQNERDKYDKNLNAESNNKFNIESIKSLKDNIKVDDLVSKTLNKINENTKEDEPKQDFGEGVNIHQNDKILKIHCVSFFIISILKFITSIGYNPNAPLSVLEGLSGLLSIAFLIFSIYVIYKEYKFIPNIKMHRAYLILFVLITPVYYIYRHTLTKTLKTYSMLTVAAFVINIVANTM